MKVERGLGGREAIETACDAGLALDWKWSYGDGSLGLLLAASLFAHGAAGLGETARHEWMEMAALTM